MDYFLVGPIICLHYSDSFLFLAAYTAYKSKEAAQQSWWQSWGAASKMMEAVSGHLAGSYLDCCQIHCRLWWPFFNLFCSDLTEVKLVNCWDWEIEITRIKMRNHQARRIILYSIQFAATTKQPNCNNIAYTWQKQNVFPALIVYFELFVLLDWCPDLSHVCSYLPTPTLNRCNGFQIWRLIIVSKLC